ncbi:MAG: ATP-binding cassette domain-containing protein [Thermomicrobiales bacterium]
MLEARNISKRYGPVLANDRLSIAFRPGDVLGLLGENGAGKSTLLSILSGLTTPDTGDLSLDGARIHLRSPQDAIRHGIGIVYQHFSLVPTLTVREQLRLAGWRSPELPPLLRDGLTGRERIDALSLGARQRVEIAKALIPSPRYLLLDEPTSILAPSEIAHLFDLLRTIREQGTSIVLVTHKLEEALALSDRIVVLRHGHVAGSAEREANGWPEATESRLLACMFGDSGSDADVTTPPMEESARAGSAVDVVPSHVQPPILSARHLSLRPDAGRQGLHDVSLELHAGEMCAIVGIDGQGQRELAEVLTGHRRAEGEVILRGRSLGGASAAARQRAGIGYLTDDRQGEGGVPSMSVARNLLLKRQRERRFSRFGVLRQPAITEDAAARIAAWSITPDRMETPLGLLSGGNIQKVLLAREMALALDVLVANKPTHGLDARTQKIVWQAMRQIVARNGAVLFFTTDLDEARSRADRVAVMAAGRVSPLLDPAVTDRLALARMIVDGW